MAVKNNFRVTLITGGSGKFGRSMVAHFLNCGHHVVATGRSQKSIDELMYDLNIDSQMFTPIIADFTSEKSVPKILSEVKGLNIFPDSLVNNARSLDFLKVKEDGVVRREDFLGEYLMDVVVPYELTMALASQKGSRLRRVVNIGSQYGIVAANPNLYVDPKRQSPIHYSVAKAGLVHLTRELAVRLADENILVNCVAYGGVEGRVDQAFRDRYAKLNPLKRMLREDDVPGPVHFLLSEECSIMTGQVIQIDGGWTLW